MMYMYMYTLYMYIHVHVHMYIQCTYVNMNHVHSTLCSKRNMLTYNLNLHNHFQMIIIWKKLARSISEQSPLNSMPQCLVTRYAGTLRDPTSPSLPKHSSSLVTSPQALIHTKAPLPLHPPLPPSHAPPKAFLVSSNSHESYRLLPTQRRETR